MQKPCNSLSDVLYPITVYYAIILKRKKCVDWRGFYPEYTSIFKKASTKKNMLEKKCDMWFKK